jgi:tubulin alpha
MLTFSALFTDEECKIRYLLEHGLKPDGCIDPDATDEEAKSGSYETFFTETSNGKYVPRSIFVDLDPSVSDRRHGGPESLSANRS